MKKVLPVFYLEDTQKERRMDPSAPLPECTVDLTPRRRQRFRPGPEQAFTWSRSKVDGGQVVARGMATADTWGLVTIHQMPVTREKHRIFLAAAERNR